MDEVPFQDWPVDLQEAGSGGHVWTPAFGFQTPSALLEKEDFIGNPDADYFFQGGSLSSSYTYLETIQEETSDDLVSSHDSSYSDSHCHSPSGWLATDSESGSVVCVDNNDEVDCESDREIACPAKRRKQDTEGPPSATNPTQCPLQTKTTNFLTVPDSDDCETSLSRSSSLLQFETLEQQCQVDPPQSLTLSFDSLELIKSGDSSQTASSRDSLLDGAAGSKSDSSDSNSSVTTTLDASRFEASRSLDNLRTWRSFGSLPQLSGSNARRFSSENLSEDSGFGDQTNGKMMGSMGSFKKELTMFGAQESDISRQGVQKNSYVGFNAYDGDFFQNFTGNFGVSYQDLTALDRCQPLIKDEDYRVGKNSPLTDRFLQRLKHRQQRQQPQQLDSTYSYAINFHALVKLERDSGQQSNFIQKNVVSHAASVPDLLQHHQSSVVPDISGLLAPNSVFSVPKDLNFITDLQQLSPVTSSVAEKNWKLEDCIRFDFADDEKSLVSKKLNETFVIQKKNAEEMATYRQNREGSYTQAMDNRVDLSDDENSLCYKKRLPNNPIVEFDRRVLKAISEQSLQSLRGSQKVLDDYILDEEPSPPRQKRKIGYSSTFSTPDLNRIEPSHRREQEYYDTDRTKSNLEISKVDELAIREIAKLDKIIRDEQKRHLDVDRSEAKTEQRKLVDGRLKPRFETNVDDIVLNTEITIKYNKISNLDRNDREISVKATNINDIYLETQIENNVKDRNLANLDEIPRGARMDYLKKIPTDAEDYPSHCNSLLEVGNLPAIQETIERKGSIIKSSTSTSGMSDIDTDRTLRNSVKSFSGSTGSKGVHFSPVVAEVNWRDDNSASTATPERESSYSLDSSPSPEPIRNQAKFSKPKPRYASENSRRSVSQPDLSDTEAKHYQQEFLDSLHNLRQQDLSKSQPEIGGNRHKRRGSQLLKKDPNGCTIKAYVDLDGVQYKHTHLTTLAGNVAHSPTDQEQQHNSSEPQSKQPVVGNRTHDDVAMTTDDHCDARTSHVVAAATQQHAKKKGLGGFLQRLASFRLGARKSRDHHNKNKRKATPAAATAPVLHPSGGSTLSAGNNMTAAKPSYIYIPLKGPPSQSDNNNISPTVAVPVSAGKPPLPKQPPPRVVHASAKRNQEGRGQARGGGATIDFGARAHAHYDDRDDNEGQSDFARRTRRNNVGHAVGSMETPMGLIETDLDTEVTVITNTKARSLLNLGEPRLSLPPDQGSSQGGRRPHKSMEFLLDKENHKAVEPPENELQKTERVMSEHELRVQRSLQKLTIPDWYKQNQVPQQGFLLKKQSPRDTRWTGTGSKTTSLSSLGSPQVLSPTPSIQQPFVRWSTSKLNSTASSPCQSTRSSFNQGRHQPVSNGSVSPCSSARSSFSYRQPYLGWRSQERLNRTPRTPSERLASSLLAHQHTQNHHNHQQESPEIQTSIKEVTSAIVHYVKGLKPHDAEDRLDHSRSNSVSPRGSQKFCWLESSFVGTKPADSPETPLTCSESPVPPPLSQNSRLELLQGRQSNTELTCLEACEEEEKEKVLRPSPSSTTLEDVLDSLLGLPSSGRAASPCLVQGRRHVQPYLGWRSQERLNRTPRTPSERLASSLLAHQHTQNHHNHQQESPEIQTSIKEVTSAIVHYVKGLKPHDAEDRLDHSRSNSVSPRGSQKFCWLESSFVGTKPADSPETPLTCSESPVPPPLSQNSRLELLQGRQSNTELTCLEACEEEEKEKVLRPSPSSTTLEDVLDSLLGLPSSGRAASPCLVQEIRSASTSPRRRSSDISAATCDASSDPQYRRRSEGSEPYNPSMVTQITDITDAGGKVSTPAIIRCRYSRCGKTIMATSREATGFKNCHNCTYTYCSRACRRNHWERHRKTCLFSRIGTLCRQVIASAKEEKDSLKVLSKVARRGYLSHGPGAVKCFYPNPESAEKFLADGLCCLGELTYVRWQDLLPSEMGPQLYEEMVAMCKNYNPDSKLVLYVSICVVSETPASGAIKWERQLVSRCAKIKLSRENIQLLDKEIMETAPETVIFTCPPIRLPTKEISLKARRVAVENLYEQLRERGISIKRQYPDLYRRLEAYCSDLIVKFGNAITVYPRSNDKSRRCTNTFMCIIMLECDPEQLKKVEKAGVKVRTIDVLLSSETTAL